MSSRPLKRILLVEDEPHLQMVARVTLERVGNFEVLACSSGREALDQAPSFAPDLILLDVMMPGMDGVATLKTLQGNPATAPIPVVFMTARAQKSEIESYRAMGALGVVSKPFDPMTLPELLKEIWADSL